VEGAGQIKQLATTTRGNGQKRWEAWLGSVDFEKTEKTPEFGKFFKFFEIVRKKAKFPERRGPNSPKLIEIHRNSSKLFETQSQGIQGLVVFGAGSAGCLGGGSVKAMNFSWKVCHSARSSGYLQQNSRRCARALESLLRPVNLARTH